MPVIEAIKRRKSVRTFSDQPIAPETKEDITRFINGLEVPFGAKVRIRLISSQKYAVSWVESR